jgi:hypothetical protein
LVGCGAADSSRAPAVVAPPLPSYAAEFQSQAANELEALPPPCAPDTSGTGCSATKRLVLDYGDLRQRIRALRGPSP